MAPSIRTSPIHLIHSACRSRSPLLSFDLDAHCACDVAAGCAGADVKRLNRVRSSASTPTLEPAELSTFELLQF